MSGVTFFGGLVQPDLIKSGLYWMPTSPTRFCHSYCLKLKCPLALRLILEMFTLQLFFFFLLALLSLILGMHSLLFKDSRAWLYIFYSTFSTVSAYIVPCPLPHVKCNFVSVVFFDTEIWVQCSFTLFQGNLQFLFIGMLTVCNEIDFCVIIWLKNFSPARSQYLIGLQG